MGAITEKSVQNCVTQQKQSQEMNREKWDPVVIFTPLDQDILKAKTIPRTFSSVIQQIPVILKLV